MPGLIERLRAMAERVGGPAVVFTFDPSPTRILRPEAAPEPLLWLERKIEILAELGADAVLVYPTDKSFLEMEAREFFDRVVRDRLGGPGDGRRAELLLRPQPLGQRRGPAAVLRAKRTCRSRSPRAGRDRRPDRFQFADSLAGDGGATRRGPGDARPALSHPRHGRSRGGPRAPRSAIRPPTSARSTPFCRAKGFTPRRAPWPKRHAGIRRRSSLGPNPTFGEGGAEGRGLSHRVSGRRSTAGRSRLTFSPD